MFQLNGRKLMRKKCRNKHEPIQGSCFLLDNATRHAPVLVTGEG